jgi:tRNA pseudouridine38-40 synthase
MARVLLRLAYEGGDFEGWQVQETPEREPRTVQGELESALARVLKQRVRVHGAGRTDSGVHALAQAAHFDVPEGREGIPWQKALNSLLPGDVRVTSAEAVADDFHARYSALSKTYAYSLWLSGRYVLPQRRRFTWRPGEMDLDLLNAAAVRLVGEHDFAGFMNAGSEVSGTTRRLDRCEFGEVPELGATASESVLMLRADGFLKQMVRNVVGLLAEVGRKKHPPEIVDEVLASRDRSRVDYVTAPARGLTLVEVEY